MNGTIIVVEKLICSVCREEVYVCDDCQNYFFGENELQCIDGEHFHKSCNSK
jgi:hypothetical protein